MVTPITDGPGLDYNNIEQYNVIINMSNKEIQLSSELRAAVQTIKTAILQSQARAVKGVNQEQLALYYGIGRYISKNTRNQKWGSGALKSISERLRHELPGLRGSARQISKICVSSMKHGTCLKLIRQFRLTN